MADSYLPRQLDCVVPGAISLKFGMVLQDFPRNCGMFVLHSLPGSQMHGYQSNAYSRRLKPQIVDYLKGSGISEAIAANPVEGHMKPHGPVLVVATTVKEYGEQEEIFTEAGWTPSTSGANGVWKEGHQLTLWFKWIPMATPSEEKK